MSDKVIHDPGRCVCTCLVSVFSYTSFCPVVWAPLLAVFIKDPFISHSRLPFILCSFFQVYFCLLFKISIKYRSSRNTLYFPNWVKGPSYSLYVFISIPAPTTYYIEYLGLICLLATDNSLIPEIMFSS